MGDEFTGVPAEVGSVVERGGDYWVRFRVGLNPTAYTWVNEAGVYATNDEIALLLFTTIFEEEEE